MPDAGRNDNGRIPGVGCAWSATFEPMHKSNQRFFAVAQNDGLFMVDAWPQMERKDAGNGGNGKRPSGMAKPVLWVPGPNGAKRRGKRRERKAPFRDGETRVICHPELDSGSHTLWLEILNQVQDDTFDGPERTPPG